jgi:3-oxoadipate enol-lactonase
MAGQSTSGEAEVNGTRLRYDVAGEGHPLVLIHGGLEDRRVWDDQFDTFAQHYRVIRYDVRGYGESPLVTTGTYEIQGPQTYSLSQDLYELLRFLEVERAYLLGQSMGAGLAVDFLLAHPEMVDALIPAAPGLGGYEFVEEEYPLEAQIEDALAEGDIPRAVDLTLQLWTAGPQRSLDAVSPAVRARVREMALHNFERPDEENALQPEPLEPRSLSRLAEISVPTMVMVGAQDVRDIQRMANLLAAYVPGARRVVMPDTAHHLNMEQPDLFNQLVLDFLSRL